MCAPAAVVPGSLSVAGAFADHLLAPPRTAFPSSPKSGKAVGLVTFAAITRLSAQARQTTAVDELAHHDAALLPAPEEPVTRLLQREAFQRHGRIVIVDDGRRPSRRPSHVRHRPLPRRPRRPA
jgi:hypothetical protein